MLVEFKSHSEEYETYADWTSIENAYADLDDDEEGDHALVAYAKKIAIATLFEQVAKVAKKEVNELFPQYKKKPAATSTKVNEKQKQPANKTSGCGGKCQRDHTNYDEDFERCGFPSMFKKGGKYFGATCKQCSKPMLPTVSATAEARVCRYIAQGLTESCLATGFICTRCYNENAVKESGNRKRKSRTPE